MKNVVSLLLIIGLLVVGWMNRDKLQGLVGSSSTIATPTPEPAPAPAPVVPQVTTPPPATPNPARESQALAIQVYPGLKNPDSALNKKFVALHADAERHNPALLAQSDWPIKLAERAMVELGGAPMPLPTPTPQAAAPLTGSPLDIKSGRLNTRPSKSH